MVSHYYAKHVVGLFGILLLCSFLCATVGQAASFRVQTDRQSIYEEESFRLIFETGEEVSSTPDFSVLERDFEVLGKQQGSTFQSINGQSSHKTTWTVTLLAKQPGSFTIPSIAFGPVQSPEYTVTIRKGSASGAQKSDAQAKDLFLEVTAKPEKTYVQSQVIYTVRFFRSVEISGASLTEPQLSASDAVVEKLGDDQTSETTRQGTRYLVVDRRYALYPQRSGTITISPLRLEAQVGKRGIIALLDDPFNAGGGGGVKRRHSAAITLEVEPIPGSFKGAAWLPAHRLQLMEKWSENPPTFQVGEAITRTLTVLADGLTSAQLPEISDIAQLSGSQQLPIKLYPDQPALTDQREATGIIGMRQEKVALVPAKPGNFLLPAIQIAWWNVDTQRAEVAELPERSVTVRPATEPSTPPLAALETPPNAVKVPGVEVAPKQGAVAEPSATEIKSGNGVATLPAKGEEGAVIAVAAYPAWLTHFLAIGWVVTLLMVWLWPRLSFSRHRAVVEAPRLLDVEKQAALLMVSCLQNNPEKCRVALLKWAQACWPEQILHNLNDLQRFFEQLQQASLVQEMGRLNQVLFSPTPGSWSGQGLWQAVRDLPKQTTKPPVQVLPPLYS